MIELALGFVAGVAVTAIVAHNKPEWFAKVVKQAAVVTNEVQDKVKAEIKK